MYRAIGGACDSVEFALWYRARIRCLLFGDGSYVRRRRIEGEGSWPEYSSPCKSGLALILLVSSGLLINSFVRLTLDDRGFDPVGIQTFEYRIPITDYLIRMGSYHGLPSMEFSPPTAQVRRVYESLKTLPGTESVAGSSASPVNVAVLPTATLEIEGKPVPSTLSERTAANAIYFFVTDNFFETMKTPILHGRDFNAGDTRSSPWVAVINETLAQRFWPGEDPIGKHFTVDAGIRRTTSRGHRSGEGCIAKVCPVRSSAACGLHPLCPTAGAL
jgi:hypothetical protein